MIGEPECYTLEPITCSELHSLDVRRPCLPRHQPLLCLMAGDDYSSAISGGLKLKGGKPVGVTKKKKKDKTKESKLDKDPRTLALGGVLNSDDKALVPRENTEGEEKDERKDMDEDSHRDSDGKTEAERRHEEMRKKRVCQIHLVFLIRTTILLAFLSTFTNGLPNSLRSASKKKASNHISNGSKSSTRS